MSTHSEPENSTAYVGYSDLHYASERQFVSRFAVAGYDRGELTLHPTRIVFRGVRGRLECLNVTSVEWVEKPFPWPIAIAVGLGAFGLAYFQAPELLAWNRPLPYLLLGFLLVLSRLVSRDSWVEVCYEKDGASQRAYFQRSPVYGFGSSRKRTRLLMEEIRSQVLRR